MPPVVSTDDAIAYLLTLDLSVPVFDDLPNTEQPIAAFVLVGHNGDVEADLAAGGSLVERAAFEGSTRDEAGEVVLAVIAQSGRSDSGDLAAVRSTTSGVLAEIGAAVEADPTLGGAVSDSWVAGVETFQGRNDAGAIMRRVVTLSYETMRDGP